MRRSSMAAWIGGLARAGRWWRQLDKVPGDMQLFAITEAEVDAALDTPIECGRLERLEEPLLGKYIPPHAHEYAPLTPWPE